MGFFDSITKAVDKTVRDVQRTVDRTARDVGRTVDRTADDLQKQLGIEQRKKEREKERREAEKERERVRAAVEKRKREREAKKRKRERRRKRREKEREKKRKADQRREAALAAATYYDSGQEKASEQLKANEERLKKKAAAEEADKEAAFNREVERADRWNRGVDDVVVGGLLDITGINRYKDSTEGREKMKAYRQAKESGDLVGQFDAGFTQATDLILDNPRGSIQDTLRDVTAGSDTSDYQFAADRQRLVGGSTRAFDEWFESTGAVDNDYVRGGVDLVSSIAQAPVSALYKGAYGVDPFAQDFSTEADFTAGDTVEVALAGGGGVATKLFGRGARYVTKSDEVADLFKFSSKTDDTIRLADDVPASATDDVAKTVDDLATKADDVPTPKPASATDDVAKTADDFADDLATKADDVADAGKTTTRLRNRIANPKTAAVGGAGAGILGTYALFGTDTTTATTDPDGSGGDGSGGSDPTAPDPTSPDPTEPDPTTTDVTWPDQPTPLENLTGGWLLALYQSLDGTQSRFMVLKESGSGVSALDAKGVEQGHPSGTSWLQVTYLDSEEEARNAHRLWMEANGYDTTTPDPGPETPGAGGAGTAVEWSDWTEYTTIEPWTVFYRTNTNGEAQYLAGSQNAEGENVYLAKDGGISYSPVLYDNLDDFNAALDAYYAKADAGEIPETDMPGYGPPNVSEIERETVVQSSDSSTVTETTNNRALIAAVGVAGLVALSQAGGDA